MSSEYIRQLEEANTKLSTMIEKMDDRCQWLEKLRQMRVKSSWDLSTKNQIGINNYKTKTIVGQKDVYEEYKFKNCDKKINQALAEIDYSSIQKNCVSLNSANKDVIRIGYKTWKNVFPAFISHSNYMLSLKKYSFIEKISLTTSVELYLQTYEYLEPDAIYPVHLIKESIVQGATVIVKRGEKVPKVSIIIRKNFPNERVNNVKFMNFEEYARAFTNIFEKVEKMNHGE